VDVHGRRELQQHRCHANPDTINTKHITGSFTAANKVYDGNNSATVLTRSLVGVVGSDVVSLTGGRPRLSTRVCKR